MNRLKLPFLLTLSAMGAGFITYLYVFGNSNVGDASGLAMPEDGVESNRSAHRQTIEIEFTKIPSGTLKMGTNENTMDGLGNGHFRGDERPEHDVYVKEFEISTYEITREQYAAFVNAVGHSVPAWPAQIQRIRKDKAPTPYGEYDESENFFLESDRWVFEDDKWRPFPGFERYPVNLVSYDDCREFASWLGYRLPTEAEWEWAAAGAEDYRYPWGNDYVDEANIGLDYAQEASNGPDPVGSRSKDVSGFGVYDLGGNVMEWVEGTYESYPGSDEPFINLSYAVNRGGSWGYAGRDQFTYSRFVFPKKGLKSRWHDIGCRVARDVSFDRS